MEDDIFFVLTMRFIDLDVSLLSLQISLCLRCSLSLQVCAPRLLLCEDPSNHLHYPASAQSFAVVRYFVLPTTTKSHCVNRL